MRYVSLTKSYKEIHQLTWTFHFKQLCESKYPTLLQSSIDDNILFLFTYIVSTNLLQSQCHLQCSLVILNMDCLQLQTTCSLLKNIHTVVMGHIVPRLQWHGNTIPLFLVKFEPLYHIIHFKNQKCFGLYPFNARGVNEEYWNIKHAETHLNNVGSSILIFLFRMLCQRTQAQIEAKMSSHNGRSLMS